jgi:hypothetical protein
MTAGRLLQVDLEASTSFSDSNSLSHIAAQTPEYVNGNAACLLRGFLAGGFLSK